MKHENAHVNHESSIELTGLMFAEVALELMLLVLRSWGCS